MLVLSPSFRAPSSNRVRLRMPSATALQGRRRAPPPFLPAHLPIALTASASRQRAVGGLLPPHPLRQPEPAEQLREPKRQPSAVSTRPHHPASPQPGADG